MLKSLDSKFPAVDLTYALKSDDPVSYIPCALSHGSTVGAVVEKDITRDMMFGLAAGGVSFRRYFEDGWIDDMIYAVRAEAREDSGPIRRAMMRQAKKDGRLWVDVGGRVASVLDSHEVGVPAVFLNPEDPSEPGDELMSRDAAIAVVLTNLARLHNKKFKHCPLKLPDDVFSRRGDWSVKEHPFSVGHTGMTVLVGETITISIDDLETRCGTKSDSVSILYSLIRIKAVRAFDLYPCEVDPMARKLFVSWLYASSDVSNDVAELFETLKLSNQDMVLTYPVNCAAVEMDYPSKSSKRKDTVLRTTYSNGIRSFEYVDNMLTQAHMHKLGRRFVPLSRFALACDYRTGVELPLVPCNVGHSFGWVLAMSDSLQEQFDWMIPTMLTSLGPCFRFASRALVRSGWPVSARYGARKAAAFLSGDGIQKAPEQGFIDAYAEYKLLGRSYLMPLSASGHSTNNELIAHAAGYPAGMQMELRRGNVLHAKQSKDIPVLYEVGHIGAEMLWHNVIEDAIGIKAAHMLTGGSDFPFLQELKKISDTQVEYRAVSGLIIQTSGERVPPMTPMGAANLLGQILR